jgi:hypothetical protein
MPSILPLIFAVDDTREACIPTPLIPIILFSVEAKP